MASLVTSSTPVLAYARPAGAIDADEATVWREGDRLAARPDADGVVRLPLRCVACNRPVAPSQVLRQRLHWHAPQLHLLWLWPGLWPIYFVALLSVNRTATVDVGLCAAHVRRRPAYRRAIRSASAVAIVLVVVGMAATYLPSDVASIRQTRDIRAGAFLGSVSAATGAILLARQTRPGLRALRIDRTTARFKRVCPAYLADLPIG